MIRGLIKLGTVALAGYAVYSIYDLNTANRSTGQSSQQSNPFTSRQGRPENIPDFGTEVGGARIAGGGRGEASVTQEATGTMASHSRRA